jgi:hypothetical protein
MPTRGMESAHSYILRGWVSTSGGRARSEVRKWVARLGSAERFMTPDTRCIASKPGQTSRSNLASIIA